MSIKEGDRIPQGQLMVMEDGGPKPVDTQALFAGKKVVLFAVPGAFTPGCSITHLPGYVKHAEAIKAKGVDSIVCMSVNDAFVMDAWGKAHDASQLIMAADGSGEFAKALGLALDASGFGMGTRSQRFSMLVEDGVLKRLNVEDSPASIQASSAETMLAAL